MIRILFLARSLEIGGAERQLVELVKRLDPQRFQVSVLTFYSGGSLWAELERAGSVRLHSLEKQGRWDWIGFGWRLCRAALAFRPHIVHGYLGGANECAWLAGRLAGARVVWGLRASNVDFAHYHWLFNALFLLGAPLSWLVDLTIVNSEAGRRHHLAHGYRGRNLIVVPNGIDTARFRPDRESGRPVRAGWQVPEDAPLVGMVGRLDPMKDHPTFLRAAAALARERPEACFVCVGGGPAAYQAGLSRMAESLGLHTRLRWTGPHDDMPSVYNALDVLALPSAYGEGFPNVVGEAMACGLPCVVTDVGDAARVVGETGQVVPPGDPQTLARALARVLALPPAERQALGAAARVRVEENFNVQLLKARTEAALMALTGSDVHEDRGQTLP